MLLELAVPGMRHHPPDSSTHPRQASVPPAAEPAWGWGSCQKLAPADSALPTSPPRPSSTPGTARSSGGLPRGPDSLVCGAGTPSHLGACQRSSGPQPPHQGPCLPWTCCPRQVWATGGPGVPTSAQLLPGPCELREGPAPAHSLIPSSPPAQPASGITCNWNLGSPASSGTQGTWPQAKSGRRGGEGARSWPCHLPGQWGGPGGGGGGGPQVLPDQASCRRGSCSGEELWPHAHSRPSKLSPACLEMPWKGALELHRPQTLAASGRPPLLVDKPRLGLPSGQSTRPEFSF